ncbi:FKBP-type peptidyl-prolyl cis-trans isomerase SlpA [hydrothermal vent metagenome]|uniref:peptidylprolyl isomerase n=1 Tax=hydrothermal vent metagenome TaxID=652676 RepID=A0A3B1ANW9_9ZZZZ
MSKIESLSIGENSEVVINFTLTLADGTVVDASEENEPMQLRMGDGSLIDGLEQTLYGMKVGDHQCVSINPRDGFGFPDETNFHEMSRSEFDQDINLEPGLIIGFSTPAGDEIPGTIKEIKGDTVLVDFNHPLAGHEIIFEVEVLSVGRGEA